MRTLNVSASGQITLRKDMLKHLGVEAGDKVAMEKLPSGRIELRAAAQSGTIADVFDLLKRKKARKLSIAAINGISAHGWAGKR